MRTLCNVRLPLTALCVFVLAAAGRAAELPAVQGRVVTVTSPTSESVARIRAATTKDLERFNALNQAHDGRRPKFKFVFDFTPDGTTNHSTSYGACWDLADCIRELSKSAETTAFVHGAVKGHSVLPVLACGDIVMSNNATIGPVLGPDANPLPEDMRGAYKRFTQHRGQDALVEKLYDPTVVAVQTRQHKQDADAINAWADALGVVGFFVTTKMVTTPQSFVAADDPRASNDPDAIRFRKGVTVAYTFRDACATGLCQNPKEKPIETRDAVVKHLSLSRSSLVQHPLLLETIKAGHIELTGPVNQELYQDLQRRIRAAADDDRNVLILELKCGGGTTSDALQIANYLRGLNGQRLDSPITTIAYYTADARDTALYLALACDMFFIAPGTANTPRTLGDFSNVLQGKSAEERRGVAKGLEDLARAQGYPARLVRAFIDPSIKPDEDPALKAEKPPGAPDLARTSEGVLALSADEAVQYRLADGQAEDLDALYHSFGLKKADVKDYGDDWINDLRWFLCHPVTFFFLVMIGIICLILELKIPGATLPGVIAAVCFVLIFWSRAPIAGDMIWLAILLFVLGLILLGIEIFILPGFGVCGVAGLILTFTGLALVAVGKWPNSSAEWVAFGNSIGWLGLSMVAAIGAAMMLGRYLPTVPIASRLFLTPELDTQEGAQSVAPFVSPEIAGLLGAIGVTATPLRPAGKVQFGDKFIDVVTESSYVEPGSRVQVIEIEGNRVVVKQV